jgi:hypothetical protein
VSRLAGRIKWILLVPLWLSLLAVDVAIARRAIIGRRNRAEYDGELARLNEHFKAARPRAPLYEPADLTLF